MLQIPVLKLLSFLLLSLFVQCQLTGSVSAQNSRFEKSRQWVDDTGQYRITATLQKLQDSTVTLLKKNGEETKLPINRLSKEDIEFLDGYRNSKFQELKTKHSEFIFASAVLESSKNYLEQGIATEEQKQELLNRIKELEPYSDSDGILFPKQIIRKNDYLAKRAEAADLVTSWIENKKGDEDHKLKLAKQIDPTSMESDLLLAIYAETYDANHRLAQRYLSDAMKQALRYRELWEATDKYNFLAIVNNLSVSYARSGYVGKAVRIWRQADKELNYEEFPQQLVSSIVRIDRMLKDRRSGIKATKKDREEVADFMDEANIGLESGSPDFNLPRTFRPNPSTQFSGSLSDPRNTSATKNLRGGWRLLLPKDHQGNLRNKLEFLLFNQEAQSVNNDVIVDTRCIVCNGIAIISCPYRECRKGAVEHPVYGNRFVTAPDGTRISRGYGIIRIDNVRCGTCQGKGQIVCPCCNQGMQN